MKIVRRAIGLAMYGHVHVLPLRLAETWSGGGGQVAGAEHRRRQAAAALLFVPRIVLENPGRPPEIAPALQPVHRCGHRGAKVV